LAEEVYDVKALGTNGVIYGDWVEFGGGYDLTKPVTLTVDLTNIGLIKDTTTAEDGSEVITSRVPTAGIIPKNAKVSIQFDEDWEGNVNPPNGGYHAVYMDGFTLTRNATAIPEVTEVTADMDIEGKVTANYSLEADASVYKVTAMGKTVVFYDKNAIVVPEDMRKADDLSLTVVPYANGVFGEEVTVSVTKPEYPAVITLTQEDGMVTVYSDTNVDSAKLIFVSYDANGKMIDIEDAPLVIVADMPEVYAPADLDAGATTKAILIADYATLTPLTKSISW